jgi:hypothetical protein
MPSEPRPVALDLGDFDAVGVATEIVLALRRHAIEHDTDAAATVTAPSGWQRLVVTARSSGHVVLGVRYSELSRSRWNNVADALERRGWELDEDLEGATRRFPPGTEATTAAFEVLAATTLSGAPPDVRSVRAVDGRGAPVALD